MFQLPASSRPSCCSTFNADTLDLIDRFDKVTNDTYESIAGRIYLLKQVLDGFIMLANQEINFARHDDGHIHEAIDRSKHIVEIIGESGYSKSPGLIREGWLDEFSNAASVWKPLGTFIAIKVFFI